LELLEEIEAENQALRMEAGRWKEDLLLKGEDQA
jgi:hypothetical protein